MRATHALNVLFALLFFMGNWHTACMAKVVMPHLQTVSNRNPLIKYKAFALPQALFFRNFFQIFQNTAFQMVNLIKTLLQHVSRGLFTTNATCTKHRNFPGAFV